MNKKNKAVNVKRYIKSIKDGYENINSGFGTSKDSSIAVTFKGGTLLNRVTLEQQFRTNWIARKIIEIPAEDALREWITFSTKDKSIKEDIHARMETMGIEKIFYEALLLSRLYGGSVIFVGAMDGRTPDQPLNENNIKSINFLQVFDRWQLRIQKRFSDPLQANFDQPELYSLQPTSFNQQTVERQIHSSRLIRFDGSFLPRISVMSHSNDGWFDSVLISINDAIRNFTVSQQSGATLLQDFITKVLKIPNLADALELDSTVLNKRFALMAANASNSGVMAIGDEEEFTKIQTPITGLVKLMEQYVDYVSAAASIPKTRLFGQQLGVLAGAKETTKEYFDRIRSWQKRDVLPNIDRLITLMLKDKSSKSKGIEPEDWAISFNSLVQDDNETKANIRKVNAETDKINIESGVQTVEEVRNNKPSLDGRSELRKDKDITEIDVSDFHYHKEHDGSFTGFTVAVDDGNHIHLESSSVIPENPVWTGIQENIENGNHIHKESTGQNTSIEIN